MVPVSGALLKEPAQAGFVACCTSNPRRAAPIIVKQEPETARGGTQMPSGRYLSTRTIVPDAKGGALPDSSSGRMV